jgi:mannose-6-phosphate isomerase-like protein (cupin superfamily)
MIVQKPWGEYEDIVRSEKYVVKTLTVNPGESTSLQTHKLRNEFWYIVSGCADVQLGKVISKMKAGQTVHIYSKDKHRVINNGDVPVVILEMQYGESCDEHDIERLEDTYGRG